MSVLPDYQRTIDSEVHVPSATAQLVRLSAGAPTDLTMMDRDAYWLDLCLDARAQNARACYRDHWSPRRFKRLGKVFLLPPGETIQICSDGVLLETCVTCHISPEALREWCDGDLEWTSRRLEAGLDIPEATIRGLLLRLAKELQQPGFGGPTLIELITGQLAIELARYFKGFTEVASARELAPWRMRLIDERLADVRDVPTLSELAELCKISVRQLTRGFRASRGCSLGEHIANRRIDYAKKLVAGEQSLKAIGYSLGFATPSAFCVAFRRATGKSPSEYRREVMHSA